MGSKSAIAILFRDTLIPAPEFSCIIPSSTGLRWSCNDQLPGDSREASSSLKEAGSGDGFVAAMSP